MSQDLKSFFRRLLNLREGAETKAEIIENVKDDADISSARFWTLVFAIGVASVGLNINSIPVVIGAMLISPLMGPIVSMGLALSINDWGLMRRSFRNLVILTAISIVISTIYFALTPITNAQSELLSRTQPTIFDVLIAIFGGLAGFIGVSRAKHNNVIPGVAIATALMPPLCTVGYGLATLQPQFIFGAFYLFLINSIFICLSALVVASFFKLPKHEYPDEAQKLRVKRIITSIVVIIVTPAMFLALSFVGQNNFNQNVDRYIKTVFSDQGYVLIYQNRTYSRTNPTLELAFLSDRFSPAEIDAFAAQLPLYELDDVKLSVLQDGFALTEADWQGLLLEIKGDTERAQALEARLESQAFAFQNPDRIFQELKSLEERVVDLAISDPEYAVTDTSAGLPSLLVVIYTATSTPPLTILEADALAEWLEVRFDKNTITTVFVPTPTALAEGFTRGL
jgi:uncharacterized hydrophobic protein (TIGR00271 family)